MSLQQASEAAPVLSGLLARARDAQARLRAILPLLPPQMHDTVQAGPAEDESWCLLTSSSAAAAKLRQMEPALTAHLRTQGWNVQRLRIKVLNRG